MIMRTNGSNIKQQDRSGGEDRRRDRSALIKGLNVGTERRTRRSVNLYFIGLPTFHSGEMSLRSGLFAINWAVWPQINVNREMNSL